MNNEKLNAILKSVSRSFYLSMRILPHSMRQSISLAYLLARAADSIADEKQMSRELRESLLHRFRCLVLMNFDDKSYGQLRTSLSTQLEHNHEIELIHSLKTIFLLVESLPRNDYLAVMHVIDILTRGMQLDLATFSSSSAIIALDDQKALETYTYYVAGCVGEFWTRQSICHVSAMSHWDDAKFNTLGIEFGKALQLTNIVRDIAKDAELGRCYLPKTWLNEHSLSSNDLLTPANNEKFRPVTQKAIAQALAYFDSAEQYLLAIPRSQIRLRLAALWPIFIGLKTLELVTHKANFLDSRLTIKVSRKWIYRLLLSSVFIVHSNTLIKNQITRLRENI